MGSLIDVMGAVTAGRIGERIATARAMEDAAIERWLAACAEVDHTKRQRDRIVRAATARLHKLMQPLTPQHYARIEAAYFAKNYPALARTDGRWLVHVRRSRPAVLDARADLAELMAVENAKLAGAKARRAITTGELLRLLPDAAAITGVSRQRLGIMASGR